MTAKKKRLLFMVLGVCLCALIAVLIGEGAISDNKKDDKQDDTRKMQ